MFHVKVLPPDGKKWLFLGSKGSVTRLRVHAVQISDKAKAEQAAKEIESENAGWKAKVQPIAA